jgi:hypothetical protein
MWNGNGGGPPDNNGGGYHPYLSHPDATGGINSVEQYNLLVQQQQQGQPYHLPPTQPPHYSADAVAEYARAVGYEAAASGSGGVHLPPSDLALTASSPHAAVAAAALEAHQAALSSTTTTQNAAVAAADKPSGKPEALPLSKSATSDKSDDTEGPGNNRKRKGPGDNGTDKDDDPMPSEDDNDAKIPAVTVSSSLPVPAPASASKPTSTTNGKKSAKKATTPTKSRKKPASSASASPAASRKKKGRETSKKKEPSGSSSRGVSASALAAASTGPTRFSLPDGSFPTMDDTMDPVTDVEYENLEKLMEQFCRVPLLAEFSRPLAVLHPEVCFLRGKKNRRRRKLPSLRIAMHCYIVASFCH